ncbi:MAG TPA: GNAT family N-acetyltransferase, partial [Gammaproteobacteria bacterium]|nr:GNAT family N-acetyltransferase [Gammaproteobacteria bacterium]
MKSSTRRLELLADATGGGVRIAAIGVDVVAAADARVMVLTEAGLRLTLEDGKVRFGGPLFIIGMPRSGTKTRIEAVCVDALIIGEGDPMELYFLDAQRDRPRVEAVWRSLIATGNYSYFLSWAWVETWLDTLGERGLPLELAVVHDADGDVAAFFLGRRKRVRHGMISSRTLFFNATGDRSVDCLYIEYNAIPCRRQITGGLERLLGLLPKNWDELVLPGLDPAQFPGSVLGAGAGAGAGAGQRRTVHEKQQPAHAVDLERVRACGGDYLSLLGTNVRSQIRRSQRLYREMGEARLEAASSVGQALAAFDEMLELHRDAWARRGRRSNFDTPYVSGFHRRLIERRFAA